MTEEIKFPTIGEIVKYIITSAGVLPKKHSLYSMHQEEADKKAFQTKLIRLAREEGNIQESLYAVLQEFYEFLHTKIEDNSVSQLITFAIDEFIQVFMLQIKDNGTHLSTKQSIEWILETVAMDRILVSMSKRSLMTMYWRAPSYRFLRGGNFLPSGTETALSKVLNVIYKDLGVSQIRFHNAKGNNDGGGAYYKSARRWTKGEIIPTWSNLRKNIEKSLDALNEKTNFEITDPLRKEIISSLFIARWATQLQKDLIEAYGSGYAGQFLRKFQRKIGIYQTENRKLLKQGSKYLERRGGSDKKNPAVFWHYCGEGVWKELAGELIAETKHWDDEYKKQLAIDRHLTLREFTNQWKGEIRPIVYENLNALDTINDITPTIELFVAVNNLTKFVNPTKAGLDEIQKCINDAVQSGFGETLHWLIHWVYSRYHFRNQEYRKAYDFSLKAFESAKYTAGSSQYRLINHHIELTAKMDKWFEFKKAVSWASFLDIPVRYLRGLEDPESEESLRHCFEMMKIMDYVN